MKSCIPAALSLLLLPASPAWAQDDKNYAAFPTGEGAPYALTCRPPQYLPGSRLMGPEVCKTNILWAQYRKDGMDVAADGIHDVPSEKLRTLNPPTCHPATMGGANASMKVNFSLVCD